MTRTITFSVLLFFLTVLCTTGSFGWGSTGHRFINLKAVYNLPNSMSSFKADSLFYQAHASDADARKSSDPSEAPRHYIDIDAYPDFHHLSHNLDSVIALYGQDIVTSRGILPWAIAATVDSLTAQLARHNGNAQETASDLGHYVGDAHQPLHCTADYNPNGMHSRYETTMIDMYVSQLSVHQDSIQYVSSPLDFAFDFIYHSNSLASTLAYADRMAEVSSGWDGTLNPPAAYYSELWLRVGTLTLDQIQRATVALASLWYTAWVNAGLGTSVADFKNEFPRIFTLEQNYPNPFNPTTNLQFSISSLQFVSLKVYDQLGKEVVALVNGVKQPGEYTVQWNAEGAASGVYYCRLTAGEFTATRKIVLLR
ncbi:MAG: S1/P1 nuclease [Bacteroidota bacterium]|jgi:hypothetical protein